SMLVQSLYNIVDSIFVAKIGESALAAVSLAFPIQTLMIAVAVGTGVGINSLISRRLGEGDRKAADRAASHGIILGVISWAVFALLGVFFSRPFFQLFSANGAVIQAGTDYLSIVTILSMGVFVEISVEKTLQATGNMIYPMIFQLIGAVINLIMDPVLIFGLLGFPAMGVAGAALATVLGQIISMIYSLYIVFRKDHEVTIRLKGFRFHARTVKDIYTVGAPSILMQSIGSVLNIGLNAILAGFSEAAVSVLGVYYKLQSFVFMPVFGLNQGVMPIMGYNYGARNRRRVLDALKWGCIIAVCIMAVGCVLFMGFPQLLLGMFNPTAEMLEIGVPALRTISLCFLPAALGILASTLFQAIGMGSRSLIISILRQVVIILPAAYLFSKISLASVWYAFPLAEVVSLLVSILFVWQVYRLKLRHLGEPAL
ncbi:MAG: MATE family efflux transporter, partial [Christensenellaceae bacterium]